MFSFKDIDHPAYINFHKNLIPTPNKYVSIHNKNDGEDSKCLCVLSDCYTKFADAVKKFEVKEDDTWIITYPKSGTTWAQEMIWLICNDLDYKTAKEEMVYKRCVFFEYGTLMEGIHDTMATAGNMKSPRFIKSHLPKSLLPDQLFEKNPKMVYVARNPKDVVVSYFHHHRLLDGYVGTFEEFAEAFLEDLVPWSPYWAHILDFWKLRNEENVLFLTYEDMKEDLMKVIKRVCKFFNKTYDDFQLVELVIHLDFDNMKDNEACNITSAVEVVKKIRNLNVPPELRFMRKGQVGSWKKEMNESVASRIDEWSKRNIEGTDFDLWEINQD